MNALPALEDMIPAEELNETKENIAKHASEAYQPVLDSIVNLVTLPTNSTAQVTAKVSLEFKEEDGKPVLRSSVVLGVDFTPATPRDLFDEVQRTIVSEMFRKSVSKEL